MVNVHQLILTSAALRMNETNSIACMPVFCLCPFENTTTEYQKIHLSCFHISSLVALNIFVDLAPPQSHTVSVRKCVLPGRQRWVEVLMYWAKLLVFAESFCFLGLSIHHKAFGGKRHKDRLWPWCEPFDLCEPKGTDFQQLCNHFSLTAGPAVENGWSQTKWMDGHGGKIWSFREAESPFQKTKQWIIWHVRSEVMFGYDFLSVLL